MSLGADDITDDGFLNGAIQAYQPKHGYRAATDPVFMAASVPAKSGQSVLELGCGVGVALLCLAKRVQGLNVTAVEIQSDYADLARQNLARNGQMGSVIEGDVLHMPDELRQQSFDHVMFNPPFFDATSVTPPQNAGKNLAHVGDNVLPAWIKSGLARVKPKGYLTLIHKADYLSEILTCLQSAPVGDVVVKPLAAREGKSANRIIVSARKNAKGVFRLLAPLILHEGLGHTKDGDNFTQDAQNILRHGGGLPFK